MRANDARKWLHAGLDLLPLILIPVFMIYSHRHDLSTDITIQQDVYKDFYQGVKNGLPNSNMDNIEVGSSESYNTGFVFGTGGIDVYFDTDLLTNANDKIFYCVSGFTEGESFEVEITYSNDISDTLDVFSLDNVGDFEKEYHSFIFIANESSNINIFNIYGGDGLTGICQVQLFNLSSIFGTGNEPTKEVFESYLLLDYYDFGNNQVLVGITDVPAKNNDIMSVFMDSFNNSIDKYFNMGNVFGMTNVYQWFNTNIFGGNAPTIIFSVWNIVLYEFVMDLLFLLYGLFMWFIDMCKHLMEKPFKAIK